MKWDAEQFSKSCEFAALAAERYANEVHRRKNQGSIEKDLYDEHNAKFEVYYSFVGRLCLDTKDNFLAEAEERRKRGAAYAAAIIYDRERYKIHWNAYLDGLIKSVRENNTA